MKEIDHEELTRVGPGTVMGSLFRQYWIPALMSTEVTAGGAPVRLMLLGERLIAFRDTKGRVGVMDHRCPHRCASLFLGRNEDGGLRCIYHGLKFDVSGKCIEMPNVLPHEDFKDKVKAKAYRVSEQNGIIWVYMGERSQPPRLPMIEALMAPDGELNINFAQRNCNWMQALEGDIDTSHVGFLHFGGLDPGNVPEGHPLEHLTERAPQYHVRDMPWGTSYCSYRKARAGTKTYWRCGNFLFPFWTQTPQGEFSRNVLARAFVPLDDEHTMLVFLRWTKRPNFQVPLKDGKPLGGNKVDPEYLPNSTDWLGRWRLKANETNDWLLDRDAQRSSRIYSGIDDIHVQDQAVTESMGAITNHAWEHLGPSDRMLARTRFSVLKAARAYRDTGISPCVDTPELYLGARSGYFLADPSTPWEKAYEDELARAIRLVNPAGVT